MRRLYAAGSWIVALSIALGAATVAEAQPRQHEFVRRAGPKLKLQGSEFRFGGANSYYVSYKSPTMANRVLEEAAAQGFRVVRTTGSIDIGNQDGSNSTAGKEGDVYFQYWDGTAPAQNHGQDGLQRLDYAVYRAAQLGLKLVLPLVNNWHSSGGMDQYVRWRGGQYHDEFYTDPVIRGWYKAWVRSLLERTNVYTGVRYKDDPTIMMWELGNEPRCGGSGTYPRSEQCTTATITAWAGEMSSFIKSIDKQHLVSVGDEGFYCTPGASDWTEHCGEGVDTLALTALPHVDVMSIHLYPDHWGKDVAWGTNWIQRHVADAHALGKPALLGEFGLLDQSTRNPSYRLWTDALFAAGGAGTLFWMLADEQDNGTPYPDYDGFTVYCPSPVCTMLSNFSASMRANSPASVAPVADHDSAVVPYDSAALVLATHNDVAYQAPLVAASLDLDPATPARDIEFSSAEGTFVSQLDGSVLFTPLDGFVGTARALYVVRDGFGRPSNVASIDVSVQPDPTAPLVLHSFETSTEGFAAANWNPGAGSTAQSSQFATHGASSLQVVASTGHWFGVVYASPLDLGDKTKLSWDMTALASSSLNVALQIGGSWTWCQGAWGWAEANTSSTQSVDLTTLDCGVADLTRINALYFFMGSGTFHIDNVRAE
ncbi:MAG TPA: cellulase family glycosylhydrolase [Polyangiaceae bacterium]|nr:cellulase family glycosylhydrolase [Polyangiaceae bacterium]